MNQMVLIRLCPPDMMSRPGTASWLLVLRMTVIIVLDKLKKYKQYTVKVLIKVVLCWWW